MIKIETINKYLEANNLPADKGYLLKDKGEGNFIAKWDAEVKRPTDAQLAGYVEAVERDEALKHWKRQMSRTDAGLPRFAEDIIDVLTDTQRAALPSDLRARHTTKKTLRSGKP